MPHRWNFPAGMIARKIGPALAVGCTCVIKVPAETPFTNLAIVEVSPILPVGDTGRPEISLKTLACQASWCARWCAKHHYHG